jgi:hypothetical protein
MHPRIPVKREVVGGGVAATAGNVILGGVIGLGVDAATGAGFEHVPNPVNVVLQPEPPSPPPPQEHRTLPPKKPTASEPPASPKT